MAGLLSTWAGAAGSIDSEGGVALHYAVMARSSMEVVEMVLDAHPAEVTRCAHRVAPRLQLQPSR